MILHCCDCDDCSVSKNKVKQTKGAKTLPKKLAQQTDCSHTSSSTPPHLLRSICNNLLSTLQVYSGYLLQTHLPQIPAIVCYVPPATLFLLLSFHLTSSIHCSPSLNPSLDDTFTSTNQFLKLSN